MNPNKSKIHVFSYPLIKLQDHPSINYILKHYFPTLKDKVQDILEEKSKRINKEFKYGDIPINQDIDPNELKNKQISLKNNLAKLTESLGGKKPIVFIYDSCFTNELFIRNLKEILEDDFDKYVELVTISYQDESKNEHITKKLYKDSIVILGGSFSDLEDIPDELFESELADFIKKVHNNKINSKLIGICWGQQFISSIIGFDEYFSEKIITTHRGTAQFGVMPGELITSINQVPFIYRDILNSITNNGKNTEISYPLTRTGHVDFNLLGSKLLSSASTITFLKDSITGSPIIWGNKNGNILGNQAHFEINPHKDQNILLDQFNNIIPILKETYGNKIENILFNIEKKYEYINLSKSFYTSSLLAFTDSIIKKKNHFETENRESPKGKRNITQNDVNNIISNINFGNKLEKEKLIKYLDENGYLRLSTIFDWKVNRGIDDASDILGIDLEGLIKFHKSISKGDYIIRDWGAGNGKMIDDIIKKINIPVYGVSDYAYFDIYEALVNLKEFNDIPRNIIKIFVQELIENYKEIKNGNVYEKIYRSLEKIELKSKSYKVSSMFTNKTYRINSNDEQITDEDSEFLENKKNRIEKLKYYINTNLYNIIVGYYENILLSDFNSLYIPNSDIKEIDFQVAIRSTSHVDGKDLEKILQDYVKISAKQGSIYIDNGVVRSDSGVPRINEYSNLEENNPNIKVYFIYDRKTSYITSAIILKEPFINKTEIEEFFSDGYKLLNIYEINSCSFFKIERFFRELMIFTFKNIQFLHDKDKEIIDFLKDLSVKISNLNIDKVKEIIINKINILIDDINEEYHESYTKITQKDFDFYLGKVNNDTRELFLGGHIENPSWFNQSFDRKN